MAVGCWRARAQHPMFRATPSSAPTGYGETDAAHKGQLLIHVARLLTGSDTALEAFRFSVRGMCTDQGSAERALIDMPHVLKPEEVRQTLADYREGKTTLLSSKPMSWFFPRAILITGPMHVYWNAFEGQQRPWAPGTR